MISKLLNKNPDERLGSKFGILEIKNHRFFSIIDWDLVSKKQVTPPYTPILDNKVDLKHFDNEITNIPMESPPF